MIELSIARRVHRGLALWREQGAEIRTMPAGGLSVPSCTEPGRIYRVSLADEGLSLQLPRLAASQAALQARLRGAHLGGKATPGTRPGGAAEGGPMAACRFEVHHRIPRCLLGFFDRAASGELDAAGLQVWFEWEKEAFRYGVDPDISRGELAALIEGSAVEISEDQHKASHSAAGDFARWGRLGGLETLRRYGRPWFALLGKRRWGRVGTGALDHYRAELRAKPWAA